MAFCMKQFKRWLSKGIALCFSLLIVGSFAIPLAYAADTCECFCGNRTDGAYSVDKRDSANECAQFCADEAGRLSTQGVQYIGCFTSESQYPQNSNLCWTQTECEQYPIDIAGTTYSGKWGGQSPYCSKTPATGEEMGYCLGPLLPVTLNVPIMGVTEILALGEYVDLVYQYAIPLAGIFGALMFTIAGFQYMTAGGDKGAVSKAKARMTNTVTGIILLMSVYTVAYLIDPRLTRFNELRPPLVKEAVLIDDATTCEAMFGYGFCIDGTCPSDGGSVQGACGEKGKITGDNEVDANIANAPEVGDECMYSGCDDNGKSCVTKGDNSGGVCAACNDVSSLRESVSELAIGLTPSTSVCSQIASKAQAREKNDNFVYACFFDSDFSNFSGADVAGADECVQLYTSGDEYIDCTELQDKASKREDGCDVYELTNADAYGWDFSGSLAEFTGFGSADSMEDFKNVFGDLCEQDICGVADRGEVAQGSCNFIDSNWAQDILDGSSFTSIFDEYGCAGTNAMREAEDEQGGTSSGATPVGDAIL